MRRFRVLIILAVALSMVAVACGDEDGGGDVDRAGGKGSASGTLHPSVDPAFLNLIQR